MEKNENIYKKFSMLNKTLSKIGQQISLYYI